RAEFFKYMDAANIDLKGFTERFYKKICLSELAPVLETLIYLKHETSVWFEITTLLIPGENDSEKELNEMTEWIVEKLGTDVPIHFSAFHPDFKMQDIPRTPHSTLIMARDIALKNGIQYAYVGNVHDFDRESSYCPNCNELLIGRDWYVLSDWNMKNGSCKYCQTKIPGVFEDSPGTWGSKRMRVKMS
ncbi:MAG: AmmeMemoRadiSam system radical SAM enzyme, partial [Lentisphaeria bacterium]|nr:AmmeMemoRadiSam system radical SAM enzyme [Lentisphaeria bacterium]